MLRDERRAQSLTQADLARAAGVSREWLIGVEQGNRPRAELEKLLAVLNALGLTLSVESLAASAPRAEQGSEGTAMSLTERATREAITAARESTAVGGSVAQRLLAEHGQRAARLLDAGVDPALAAHLTRLSMDLVHPEATSPDEEAR